MNSLANCCIFIHPAVTEPHFFLHKTVAFCGQKLLREKTVKLRVGRGMSMGDNSVRASPLTLFSYCRLIYAVTQISNITALNTCCCSKINVKLWSVKNDSNLEDVEEKRRQNNLNSKVHSLDFCRSFQPKPVTTMAERPEEAKSILEQWWAWWRL